MGMSWTYISWTNVNNRQTSTCVSVHYVLVFIQRRKNELFDQPLFLWCFKFIPTKNTIRLSANKKLFESYYRIWMNCLLVEFCFVFYCISAYIKIVFTYCFAHTRRVLRKNTSILLKILSCTVKCAYACECVSMCYISWPVIIYGNIFISQYSC